MSRARYEMKQNYKAWDVKIDDFFKLRKASEKLRFLLNFAVLAPSSHNSQPWSFRIEDNEIKIYADMARSLPASDSNNRQLLISLVYALEAERRGLSTAPSAAAIQIGEFYKKLQKISQTPYRPQFFARVGYAKDLVKPSPRLRMEEVIR